MVVILVISILVYLYSTLQAKKKQDARTRVKDPVPFEKKEIDLLKNEIMILKDVINEKVQTQISETSKAQTPQVVIKDEFSGVLLSLLSLERKLYFGGDVKNEIIKLRAFSGKIPEIYSITKDIEEVQKLISKEELLSEFAEYVKIVKQIEITNQQSKISKILGMLARYITILNVNKKQDEILLEAEKALEIGEFYRAFRLVNSSKPKELEKSVFLTNLEFSAKIQEAIDKIHFLISQKL